MPQKPGEFSKKVIQLALTIPAGRITTYGLLATTAGGHPLLAQMITHILGKSDKADQIPFHRIVYANGRPWLSPKHEKQRLKLYQEEGIELDKSGKIVDFEKKLYYF